MKHKSKSQKPKRNNPKYAHILRRIIFRSYVRAVLASPRGSLCVLLSRVRAENFFETDLTRIAWARFDALTIPDPIGT